MPRTQVKTDTLPVACFAPPMTDAKIINYRIAVDLLESSPIKDACDECLKAIEAWWKLPESSATDTEKFSIRHGGADKTFHVVHLEESYIIDLWEFVPWEYEIKSMRELFSGIPKEQKELRDMASHLLWHACELSLDREPLTQDKL